MNPVRHLSVIFCDDIRREIGGKHTYAGVYGASIDVEEFPLRLATFAVATTVQMPAGDLLSELELAFHVIPDGAEPVAIGSVPIDLSGLALEAAAGRPELDFVAQNVMASFAGIEFTAPSTFQVTVKMDGGVKHTRQIRVRQVGALKQD